MPKTLVKDEHGATDTYARFIAEPFEAGYGHTVGNSLRRVLLSSLEGAAITTVEGMADGGRLHPLQQAFAELGAAQCGYCTPGILLTAKALLEEAPGPTRQAIKEALAGNQSRCTGYTKILDAVELAALRMRRPGVHEGARR